MTLSGCGQESFNFGKKESASEFDRRDFLDSLNLLESEKLSRSYNAHTGWDTAHNFTYFIQELFEASERPISFIGEIKDVIKANDSLYVFKVVSRSFFYLKNFIAEISVDREFFNEIKSRLDPKGLNTGCFIVKFEKINSYLPVLESEFEVNGDNLEDASSYLTLNFDESLIKLKGDLVSCFLYNRFDEEE